jgi:UDP-glucose 4-epimerase
MILVTGARGFLGSQVVALLREQGQDVFSLIRPTGAKVPERTWEADLTSAEDWRRLFKKQPTPETVLHLAGHIDIALKPNPTDPLLPPVIGDENIPRLYRENVTATAQVLNYCLKTGVKHLVFASSQTVYGMPQEQPLTEASPLQPLEYYAETKVCAERMLAMAAGQGLNITVLRFPGLYSETRHGGAVYQLCKSGVEQRHIEINAQFPLPLDVIHVADVAEAWVKAVKYGGDGFNIFNIATGEPCSLNLLADSIAGLVPGCRVSHAPVPQPVVQMEATRARRILGWQAAPPEARLKAMLESLKANSPC